ncbi:MAG: hypothetical protein JRI23_33220 [Deltaproteobacteria bacterium]|jgi:hypothetical protein|nr:hypothetical protein [Deltaproteobacteria bacterium]MBW2537133.1 hypothetical protein [Deltaproteobacteria bacterium]
MRRWQLATGLSALVVALLAGCGDDEEGPAPPTSTGSTAVGGQGGTSAGGGLAGGGGGVVGGGGGGGFVPETGDRSALYPADWSPGFSITDEGEELFIQDYSYAGYHNGEAPLPSGDFAQLITVSTTADGSVDVQQDIQDALDQAAGTSNGAIVYLPAGTYRVDSPLEIRGDGIVLRGAGSGATELWLRHGGGASEQTALLVSAPGWLQLSDDPGWQITAEGSIFDTSVEVQDPSGISVGDDIHISWRITAEFKAEHESTDYWYHCSVGDLKTFFLRTVTAIVGDRIHFKVPLRYPVKLRDQPVVQLASGYASENGVEHLSINTAMGGAAASWQSGTNAATAIRFRFCRDCWAQDVTSFARSGEDYHLRSHGFAVERSFRVTIADSHLQKPEHLGGGGNGYLFQLTRSNEVLVRDSTGVDGRHNFSINWDFGSSGNVFQRIESSGGRVCGTLQDQLDDNCGVGPSDFHHALAIANLFDQVVIDDALQVGNRQDWSTGAGQTGTMNVFWNVSGTGMVYVYNQAMGYVIGTSGVEVKTALDDPGWLETRLSLGSEPEDYTELIDQNTNIAPQSLYDELLARRLAQ